MKLASVIKYTPDNDESLSFKWPEADLRLGSQLIVGEGQQAIFVKGGEALDVFSPGTHTLSTGNLPLIDKLINLPFNNETPFSAEIWFVNTLVKRDLLWGTPTPIQVLDKSLKIPVSLRAFGKWGIRISDPRPFLLQIVGNQHLVESEKIYRYLIGQIIQLLKDRLAETISEGLPVLEINTQLNELSDQLKTDIMIYLAEYGIELVNFNIESINIPDDELDSIKQVMAKVFEAEQLSNANISANFATIKSFEVLGDAANNQADSGMAGMMQAGLGLGAGLPLGQQMGQVMDVSPASVRKGDDPIAKLKELKSMSELGLITEDEYSNKRSEILKDL